MAWNAHARKSRRRAARFVAGAVTLAAVFFGVAGLAAAKPRFYFKVGHVRVDPGADPAAAPVARALLDKELASRPEIATDIGAATADDAALAATLKARRLQGFGVTLGLGKVVAESKPPRAGGRLGQLAVEVKLTLLGVALPSQKMVFSGEGEAIAMGEVSEKSQDRDKAALVEDAMAQALKQAVDSALLNLTRPKAAPLTESKRRRRK